MEEKDILRDDAQICVACSRLIANSPMLKGKMLNCSCKGTCIELDQRIQEGSIVMLHATVRNLGANPPKLPDGFRSFSLAEVKWSKPLGEQGFHNYAIGLKYLPN